MMVMEAMPSQLSAFSPMMPRHTKGRKSNCDMNKYFKESQKNQAQKRDQY